ncbi:hypothetical protein TNCV_4534591 [Trichonephila clavipes]|nr:hypothetical protein TNCV_4534591 [Trichonephila clavipes]
MCIVPSWHGGTLDSRRASSPLVRLVEGEERWETPDPLPQNWGGTELNRTVTYTSKHPFHRGRFVNSEKIFSIHPHIRACITRRVGQRCTLNLSRAETSSRWCGGVVRRGSYSRAFGDGPRNFEPWSSYKDGTYQSLEFSLCCDGEVRRGECHLRCRLRHLTMVQSQEVDRQ